MFVSNGNTILTGFRTALAATAHIAAKWVARVIFPPKLPPSRLTSTLTLEIFKYLNLRTHINKFPLVGFTCVSGCQGWQQQQFERDPSIAWWNKCPSHPLSERKSQRVSPCGSGIDSQYGILL